ncbi:MAG: flagellar biosynthesis protein FlgN [Treponema sp.]|nr:flagellar biosynthesis protein FlgN [Treponema sp.]
MEHSIHKEVTPAELAERVAILKRFRALLEEQRDKFRLYLASLEKQQQLIGTRDTSALLRHTELEQQVVANIARLQKVIVPMEDLYRATGASAVSAAESESIAQLQTDLSKLQAQVLAQNEKNRALLRITINTLKEQVSQLKNPYRAAQSIYAVKQPVATLVEIEA